MLEKEKLSSVFSLKNVRLNDQSFYVPKLTPWIHYCISILLIQCWSKKSADFCCRLAVGLDTLTLTFAGFLSIDCGYTTSPNYTDGNTGITYVADEGFTNAGLNQFVNKDNMQPDLEQRYSTVRVFPNGTRNCYTLRSLKQGGKYLVRATFGYGNYDTLNMLPAFDLYLGVNYWTTVNITNVSMVYIFDIITLAPANYMQICLVNIGSGTPFISEIDLRSLPDDLYPAVSAKQSLVLHSFFRDTVKFGYNRYHFGQYHQLFR